MSTILFMNLFSCFFLFFCFLNTTHVQNQHRSHNKSGSFFLKAQPQRTFSEKAVQQVVIPGAYSVLFLQRHDYVCSAEEAYGLQIFI